MTAPEAGHRPKVTAIVPTRNSERTLGRCLESLVAQTTPCEIVVVDNFSTDATQRVASRPGVHLLVAGNERSAQRNVGARAAAGEFLLFVDADMMAAPSLVDRCLAASERAGAVIVPQIAAGVGWLAKSRALEKRCYDADETHEAARFFRRDVFEGIGGYDESLHAGEDWDVAIRLQADGAIVTRCDSRLIEMYDRIRITQIFRKFRYYAPALARFRRKHPEAAHARMRFLRPAIFRHWRALVRHPVLACGIVVLKGAEVLGMLSGIVIPARHATHPV